MELKTICGHTISLDKSRHLYVIGMTGTGKSTFLYNLAMDDFKNKRGFALLDFHGDLAEQITDNSNKEMEVIYLEPGVSYGLDPLYKVPPGQRNVVVRRLISSLKSIWADSWGPNVETHMYNSLRVLVDANRPLTRLPKFLTDRGYRTKLLKKCTDPEIKAFWEEEFHAKPPRQQSQEMQSTLNKVGQFVTDPNLRSILGQPPTLNLRKIMDKGHVVVINLSKGQLGEEPARLLGAVFVSMFYQAAESRGDIPENERKPFTLYVDEFQNCISQSFASILSESRKYGLQLCLAHQYLAQIDDLKDAVFGNVGTFISFRVGPQDADIIARQMGRAPEAIIDTPKRHAWIRFDLDPHLVKTSPPRFAPGRLEAVRSHTRACYTRPSWKVRQLLTLRA